MKLSVIIAAFNAAGTIDQQLESLATQRWSETWEVIVVNNRSTDNTVKIANGFRGRVPNLRVVDAPERPGGGYAINIGARAARGELLAFCDADDIVCDGWIAAMGDALARHELVSGPFDTRRLNRSELTKHRINPQPDGIQEYVYPAYLPHAATANLGVWHSVFDQLGGFDESMLALFDTDFCWRAQLAGHKLVAEPKAVVHYRFRDSVSGLLKQAFNYAMHNVFIYKKFRSHGMPKLTLKNGIRSWISLVLGVTRLARPETRVLWLWDAGWFAGRLYASIKYRVLAL